MIIRTLDADAVSASIPRPAFEIDKELRADQCVLIAYRR
jgi:hypothetical protein